MSKIIQFPNTTKVESDLILTEVESLLDRYSMESIILALLEVATDSDAQLILPAAFPILKSAPNVEVDSLED